MTNPRRNTLFALIVASTLCLASLTGIAADASSPEAMIKQTTDQVLATLQQDQAKLKDHPGRIYDLIENEILPHFDFEHMSRWVLGRHWRDASPQQRSQFTQQFRNLLVNTYGNALLGYSGQTVSYLPVQGNPQSGEVTVRARIHDVEAGQDIPLDYQVDNENGQWKVVDVSIDGVSLIANYRQTFDTRIQREGLDGLIRDLGNHNKQSAAETIHAVVAWNGEAHATGGTNSADKVFDSSALQAAHHAFLYDACQCVNATSSRQTPGFRTVKFRQVSHPGLLP